MLARIERRTLGVTCYGFILFILENPLHHPIRRLARRTVPPTMALDQPTRLTVRDGPTHSYQLYPRVNLTDIVTRTSGQSSTIGRFWRTLFSVLILADSGDPFWLNPGAGSNFVLLDEFSDC